MVLEHTSSGRNCGILSGKSYPPHYIVESNSVIIDPSKLGSDKRHVFILGPNYALASLHLFEHLFFPPSDKEKNKLFEMEICSLPASEPFPLWRYSFPEKYEPLLERCFSHYKITATHHPQIASIDGIFIHLPRARHIINFDKVGTTPIPPERLKYECDSNERLCKFIHEDTELD